MSGRRSTGRAIRGPNSALTDYLAANNISAQQIRDDFERRRRQQEQDLAQEAASNAPTPTSGDDEAIAAAAAAEAAEEAEKVEKSKKRKRVAADAKEKTKKAKASASKKAKKHSKKKDHSDEDDDSDFDADFAKDMYKKSRPAPGQFEHCDVCSKRFTVTPYSKEGPDGGLLCTPCGKELAKDLKAEKKATAPKAAGKKRRKIESDRLDGHAIGGAKTLQELCIAKAVEHHEDVNDLGHMPQPLLERISQIFSKKRVLKPKALPLFLRPDLDAVILHDAAYLEEEDYQQVFAMVPHMEKLVLGNACQLKDKAIDYMLERCGDLKHLQLYAANLVSDGMWHRLFREMGGKLEAVMLKWLDAAFDDLAVLDLVKYCPNLKRLKLKLCRRIGPDAVRATAEISGLEHLSLMMNQEVEASVLLDLVQRRGPQLQTLSLEKFYDLDDKVLQAVHDNCRQLSKLRISENDMASDEGYESLFTNWSNTPLAFVDFNSTRDVDNNNSDGPEAAIGLASGGFKALMAHSGSHLKHVDVASCRHIGLTSFMDVFNGSQNYPALEYINVSFCNRVDNTVIAGIFRSCPALKKLVAFGCFEISDVVVPRSIALIGVPKAQDAIEQYGVGIDVDTAVERMMEIEAAA
ncbi:Putative leucine-rich repeat domain superfamily [Septoria linicola]|uniref:Leucine-rich repeat domain superfamily n=1 Tax=Septoria linicola TaxID=215465 RepID=A0A9Q9AK65_9PEZI|nr:putative leucine-rich repeat domain superfamily [Septoria linicola]USW47436.1 Putative leucine-rich repeat domain superfamily [Septoria linicola]